MKLLDLILRLFRAKPKRGSRRELCGCGKRIALKKHGGFYKHNCRLEISTAKEPRQWEPNVGICGPVPIRGEESEHQP